MITDLYPPFIGGSYKHVQMLSQHLAEIGNEVVVVTVERNKPSSSRMEGKIKIIRLEGLFEKIPFIFKNRSVKHPPPIVDPLISKKLKHIILKEKPDILHCHGWILYSVLRLRRELGIPLVVTLHDCGYFCPKILLLKGNEICDRPLTIQCIGCAEKAYGSIKSAFIYCSIKLGRKRLDSVDKFIAVSSFVQKAYSQHLKLSYKDIIVVPNFYKEEATKTEASRLLPRDFILFVGDLAPHKGVDLLIDSYSRLATGTKLVLIGKRDSKHSFVNTDRITVVENASHEYVMNSYGNARFVIIPSRCPDSCPTVALEAMSAGKAVVAANIGGLRDLVVGGKTGLLVHPNSPEELAKAMQYLLDNPTVATEMGMRGRERFLEKYQADVVVKEIERIYSEVIAACTPTREPTSSH